uniref:Decapping nuclease n=1 Tax=Chromera velia CCMP2878 TaxID=1169474 RepID=A0A0G4G0P0_9ALVE|mmetsp:Transcript_3998/g.8207  ORF Transcript_3998/g.8207 Transcript_3998/m.8207 type:complete len:509 (+) Transcript_3998:253-1779(+)|eukprot:Cvel_19628.t1-p1 / transcript=Cvel_19628.t1 / gene=Cvel_19628 / organism=Chromera_velia_CCMP2878 / gene_product=Decapping nuclease Dom3z homolog, chloroplastic, putative / transcript_product=Decapping nuclease Dom3z homolog, chloroplastic, putative / location=Cvel_scaffold1708:23335-30211(-) / protein_length=508 / sequence_SO=supercontig / SO=protein_coding / is_pseudo=false
MEAGDSVDIVVEVQPGETDRKTVYGKPIQVGRYSVRGETVSFDDSAQKLFRAPPVPYDLNAGFNRRQWENRPQGEAKIQRIIDALSGNAGSRKKRRIETKTEEESASAGKVPDRGVHEEAEAGGHSAINKIGDPQAAASLDIRTFDLVTYRNNVNKLMNTPYNQRDPWQMAVFRDGDTIFLDVRKEPEAEGGRPSGKAPESDEEMRVHYRGSHFEHLCTRKRSQAAAAVGDTGGKTGSTREGGARDNGPPFDPSTFEEFCVIVKSRIGAFRVLMAAEIDCFDPETGEAVEIKLTQESRHEGQERRFHQHKLRSWWIQSYTAGVPRIFCGTRTPEGKLTETRSYRTTQLPSVVAQRRAREGERERSSPHWWEPRVCLSFLEDVLVALKKHTSSSHWQLETQAEEDEGQAGSGTGAHSSRRKIVSDSDANRCEEGRSDGRRSAKRNSWILSFDPSLQRGQRQENQQQGQHHWGPEGHHQSSKQRFVKLTLRRTCEEPSFVFKKNKKDAKQ